MAVIVAKFHINLLEKKVYKVKIKMKYTVKKSRLSSNNLKKYSRKEHWLKKSINNWK